MNSLAPARNETPGAQATGWTASRLQTAGILILLAVLWITTRPYLGIVHDARLYTVQALNAAYPGRFADDLFFKYGSQDSFTLFSPLYRPLIAALGVGRANMVAAALGQGLWLGGLAWLLTALFEDSKTRVAAALGVILLYSGYGGLGVFRYGEPFATPRIFAEAGVLASLAAALSGRRILAVALVILAGAIHPIMAATGGAMLVLMAAFKDRRLWIVIVAGAAAVAGAALLGIGPFGRLLLRFDDAWFQVVKERCGFGLLSRWALEDWLRLIAQLAVVGVAWTLGTTRERQLVKLAAIASAGALALAYLGGDLGRNILVVNVQPWRMLWLLSLLANAFAVVTVLRLPRKSAARGLFIGLVVVNFAADYFGFVPGFLSILAIVPCGVFAWERWRRGPLLKIVLPLAFSLPLLGICVVCILIYKERSREYFALNLVGCGLAVIALATLFMARKWPRPSVLALAALFLVIAIASIDRRTNWQKVVEAPMVAPGLEQFLDRSNNIYWEGEYGMELIWLNANSKSYYSCLQGTGAMFYRGTAIEYARRTQSLRRLNTDNFSDSPDEMCPAKAFPNEDGPAIKKQLVDACQALPELDAIVLARPVKGIHDQTWTAPAENLLYRRSGQLQRIRVYYKYNCAELR